MGFLTVIFLIAAAIGSVDITAFAKPKKQTHRKKDFNVNQGNLLKSMSERGTRSQKLSNYYSAVIGLFKFKF